MFTRSSGGSSPEETLAQLLQRERPPLHEPNPLVYLLVTRRVVMWKGPGRRNWVLPGPQVAWVL